MKEACKVLAAHLSCQGEHQALDVGKQLARADVLHVFLHNRDRLQHDGLDLSVQLLHVNTRVLRKSVQGFKKQ